MSSASNELRKKLTKQEGWLSIIVNILLFGFKYYAGIVSGSLALVADAWHTLSDSISSVFVLISSRYSYKKPDKEHPFGHGRFELITSIFIGILLILIAAGFIKEGIEKLINTEEAHFGLVAIIATVISILLKEALAQYAFWGYRKTDSGPLKADGWHHRSDALSSVVILVGIFVGRFVWWIDALLSIIVALFLMYAAYEIIKNTISNILGEPASPELVNQIEILADRVAGTKLNLHHLHLHNYVTHKEVTFHICLPNDLKIEEAHKITNAIELSIKDELDIEATVHIDPIIM